MKRGTRREHVLAIDQGTTSTRSMVVNATGSPVAVSHRKHRQLYPRPGCVEHDPEEIWTNVELTVRLALRRAQVSPADLAGIGLANQGETVMAWDAETLKPLGNAIVWQCSRTSSVVERMKSDRRVGREVHRTTGLVLDSYFSATKMKWIYDNMPECRKLSRQRRLRMGTLDTWLLARMSRGSAFCTDTTTASRTLLMDLSTGDWSPRMLDLFGVDGGWLA
ncbi:MAG TPA: FGGY family carbohydrate kinase, partial [Bryobacteraceae bacterium]|nr:FGGY family carbohydrate kinase [Bryobacteraceae bacterium]